MKDAQMHLISKMFNDTTIRTVWNKKEEKYYISIIDLIGALTESDRPRKYWSDLKSKLEQEGSELSEKIGQLKLKSQDGKHRLTDVCDIEGMFRIIESIPSKNAEPIKQWLARLGKERIDEVFDPSLTAQRAIDTYRAKGYDEEWIIKRIRSVQNRKKLTDTWNNNGVTEEIEYAILTNEIYREWSGMTAQEYKEFKGLRKESLRDNMTDIEVALADLGEIATRELARDELEKNLGKSVVSKDKSLTYKYIEEDLMIDY